MKELKSREITQHLRVLSAAAGNWVQFPEPISTLSFRKSDAPTWSKQASDSHVTHKTYMETKHLNT